MRPPGWPQFPSLVKPEQRDWLQKEILGSTQDGWCGRFGEALELMTAQGPLIMVLEDLHWVDNSTLDVISVLARAGVPAKLVVVGPTTGRTSSFRKVR